MPSARVAYETFTARFLAQFQDPAYTPLAAELEKIAAAAWEGYSHERKSQRTRKAGPAFADPHYELALEWLEAREALIAAQARHEDPRAPLSYLIINASPRSEHTCPGEMSKSYRLVELAVNWRLTAASPDRAPRARHGHPAARP